MPRIPRSRSERAVEISDEQLPLRTATSPHWAELAARELGLFLADHAVCEQQAALAALDLVARYPDDAELVDRMSSLAAEEVSHLRRVVSLLRRRGLHPARRRTNPYVQRLRRRIASDDARELKVDRLLVAALIEARSCERFTLLAGHLGPTEAEVASLLGELGPAERRHWHVFHRLAARGADAAWLEERWQGWLRFEGELNAALGLAPRVHG